MIVRPLHPAETFYRFITPRWSHTPTSGAGAARFGGRFNRYRVALSRVVDFAAGYIRGVWDELWSNWDCEWRKQVLYEQIEPPSWLLGDLAIERGATGVLFPSTRQAGGTNLVVYSRRLQEGDELSAYDPRGNLPLDQESWRCAVAHHSPRPSGSILPDSGKR